MDYNEEATYFLTIFDIFWSEFGDVLTRAISSANKMPDVCKSPRTSQFFASYTLLNKSLLLVHINEELNCS